MVGPSVFPDTRVTSKWLDFQYFQIHGSLKQLDLQYFQVPDILHIHSTCISHVSHFEPEFQFQPSLYNGYYKFCCSHSRTGLAVIERHELPQAYNSIATPRVAARASDFVAHTRQIGPTKGIDARNSDFLPNKSDF